MYRTFRRGFASFFHRVKYSYVWVGVSCHGVFTANVNMESVTFQFVLAITMPGRVLSYLYLAFGIWPAVIL